MKEGGLGDVKFTLVSYLPRYPTDLTQRPAYIYMTHKGIPATGRDSLCGILAEIRSVIRLSRSFRAAAQGLCTGDPGSDSDARRRLLHERRRPTRREVRAEVFRRLRGCGRWVGVQRLCFRW